jgi:hypothetical protein
MASRFSFGIVSNFLSEYFNNLLSSTTMLPSSLNIIMLLTMFDNGMGNTSMKGMFVVGMSLFTILFYPFTTILFPFQSEITEETYTFLDKMTKLVPFNQTTSANYYLFILGFFVGYWVNMSFYQKESNVYYLLMYYSVILMSLFIYIAFILNVHSWRSCFLSMIIGIMMGIVWAMISLFFVNIQSPSEEKKNNNNNNKYNQGVTCSGNPDGNANEDTICQAFRIG